MPTGSTGAKKARSARAASCSETKIEYVLDVGKRLVRATFGRAMTESAICDYAKRLRADPNFSPSFAEIVDLTRVERNELSGKQMIDLADHVDPFAHEAMRAFIVSNAAEHHDVKVYGIVRLAGDRMRTFHSVEEAEEWILAMRDE